HATASSSPCLFCRPPPSPLFPYTTLFRSPEFDGRVITVPFSFKHFDSDGLARYVPDAERCARVASIAVRHARLRHTPARDGGDRSEEHTSELQSRFDLVCRLLLGKNKTVRARRRSVEAARNVHGATEAGAMIAGDLLTDEGSGATRVAARRGEVGSKTSGGDDALV